MALKQITASVVNGFSSMSSKVPKNHTDFWPLTSSDTVSRRWAAGNSKVPYNKLTATWFAKCA